MQTLKSAGTWPGCPTVVQTLYSPRRNGNTGQLGCFLPAHLAPASAEFLRRPYESKPLRQPFYSRREPMSSFAARSTCRGLHWWPARAHRPSRFSNWDIPPHLSAVLPPIKRPTRQDHCTSRLTVRPYSSLTNGQLPLTGMGQRLRFRGLASATPTRDHLPGLARGGAVRA